MNQTSLFTPLEKLTFELLQKRKDGTLSSVTFIKAYTKDEAEEIARPAICIGEKALREV